MIERINEALRDAGWRPQLYDHGHTYDTPDGRIVLYVYDDGERWVAVVAGSTTAHGPDPLTALRLAYADEDSRSVRAALWPVLVALREPEMDRLRVALSHIDAIEQRWLESLWFDRVDACVLGLLNRLPDAADRYLLALNIAGDPPEELCEAVAELRAALEVMG